MLLFFAIGIIGILNRKNLLMIFFSTEIILNAANIGIVGVSKYYNDISGEIVVFFIIAIAASKAVIGLGLLILWYRSNKNLDLDNMYLMRE